MKHLMKGWSLHACRLDRKCRSVHAPNRVSLGTPWFYFGMALNRDSRYAGWADGSTTWTEFHRRQRGGGRQ